MLVGIDQVFLWGGFDHVSMTAFPSPDTKLSEASYINNKAATLPLNFFGFIHKIPRFVVSVSKLMVFEMFAMRIYCLLILNSDNCAPNSDDSFST